MRTTIAMRIKNSRIQHGLSLQEIADRIGVTKQMINKYEQGKSVPGSDKLIALSKVFNQKIDYFFRKPEISLGEINFRKKSKFGAKRLNALKEEIRIQIENYLYIENICGLGTSFKNPLEGKLINSDQDVKEAAYTLKEDWQIGQDAVHNLIDLFENNHIKVIEVEDESGSFDGLATIVDEKYYIIVIAKNMPIERKRFTLLHELAHLILPIQSFDLKLQEKFCNMFASEMLLSGQNARVEFGSKRQNITIEELKNVQEKFGISIRAIMFKMGEVEIISEHQLKSFWFKLNADNNLKSLLDESRYKGEEHSNRFENLVYRAASEELISMSKASSLLQISLQELKNTLLVNIR